MYSDKFYVLKEKNSYATNKYKIAISFIPVVLTVSKV